MTYSIGYFIGSLATASINRTLSKALITVAPPELEFTEIEIRNLPLYSYDYDESFLPRAPRSSRRSSPPTASSSSAPSTTGPSPPP